jgi:hypothetical protein
MKAVIPDHIAHPLAVEYGLTEHELLEAVRLRFRVRMNLEGAVAEVQLGKIIRLLAEKRLIARYEEHDQDGVHDFSLWMPGNEVPIRVECKNIRNKDEGYRYNRVIVAYKVETQKTRAAKSDAISRLYDADQWDILAVCLGKKTKNWKEFLFIKVTDLARHSQHPHKLAVMHRVPLPTMLDIRPWFRTLEGLLASVQEVSK